MRFKKYLFKINQYLILFLTPFLLAAKSNEEYIGLGGVALNLMSPIGVLSGFISTACLLLGGCFLFAGVIKYMEHRRSPLMVPISTVIFLLIAGIVLILLPLIYNLAEHGVPFWLAEL